MGRKGKDMMRRGMELDIRDSTNSKIDFPDKIDAIGTTTSISSVETETNVIISASELRKVIDSVLQNRLSSLQADLTARFESIEVDHKELVSKLLSEIKSIKENTDIHVTGLLAEIKSLKETAIKSASLPSNIKIPSNSAHDLGNALNEFRERDEKKDNIIIFGLDESKAQSVNEKINDDKKSYDNICQSLHVETSGTKKIFRIGRQTEGKPRPLVIKIETNEKAELLRNAKKLHSFPVEDFRRRIIIKQDLTKKEQEVQKELVIQLKIKNSSAILGEKFFIRGNKVVSSRDS
jgi:hypothetical protein